MLNRHSFRWLCAVTALCAATQSFAILRWPNVDSGVPNDLKNNIVRVGNLLVLDNQILAVGKAGSGVVLRVKNDAQGNGAWLCVLTAHHVIQANSGVGIGFSDENGSGADTWKFFGTTEAGGKARVIDGPITMPAGNGMPAKRADLAMIYMRVANRNDLPAGMQANVALGTAAVNDLVGMAGFGDTNIIAANGAGVPAPGPRVNYNGNLLGFYEVTNTFGKKRSGEDKVSAIENTEVGGVEPHKFKAMRGTLSFALGNGPAWPPVSGDAYFHTGDSGGPSFRDGKLVGIHSASQSIKGDNTLANPFGGNGMNNNASYVGEGMTWSDVYVDEYKTWINDNCAAVPEPTTIIALGLGALLIAKRKRTS